MHQRGRNHLAVALALLDRDHALGAAPVAGVFGDAGALAVAVFSGGQHALLLVFGHQHRNDTLAVFEVHALDAARLAAVRGHLVFIEAHRLATVREQHHVVLAVGDGRADQEVALVQVHGNDADLARIAEVGQRGLLDRAHAGGHEDVLVRRERAFFAGQRQDHVDLFAILQREHVDDRAPARAARALRHFPDLEPVQPASVGETQDVVVGVGDEELVDPVVFLGRRGLLAAPATLLRPVLAQRLALDIAAVAERDHHVGRGDQVFGAQVKGAVLDLAASRADLALAKFVADEREFVGDDGRDTFRLGQDVEQVLDLGHHFLVFSDDLVLLQPGQALQAHLQDFLRLRVRQAVQAVVAHAVLFFQPVRAVVVGIDHAAVSAGAGEHLANQLAVPGARHQFGLGHRRCGRVADDSDEFVDVGQCHGQAFEHVAAFARLAQREYRAARHHFPAVLQEDADQVLQVAQLGLAVDQRHHVDAEGVLQLRLLVQVVQHHLGHFAALELDHQAHAGLVRFVLDVADAFDLLLVHQFGHALLQRLLVHLIGQLVHDDGLALAAVDVLEVALGPHDHAATPGAIAVLHAIDAVDDAGGGEIGRRDDFHQLVNRCLGVAQQVQAGVHHFIQVVRRDVGRHAHGDAAGAVDEQVGQLARQDQGLFFGAVVVRAEVDGFLVDVGQHLVRDLGQADFGVTHGGGIVAVHRTEVALAVDQHVAHGEVLGHAHDRVVNRLVAVRMVFTNYVADDAGRLLVGAVPVVVEFVHGEQHAPVHRLEAVPGIGQGAPDDHAHGVVEVASAHFLFKTDGQGFFGELGHERYLRGKCAILGRTGCSN